MEKKLEESEGSVEKARRTRRNFTPAFKRQVLGEVSQSPSIAAVLKKHDIGYALYRGWKLAMEKATATPEVAAESNVFLKQECVRLYKLLLEHGVHN